MALSDRDRERLNLISPAAYDVGLGDIIQSLLDGSAAGNHTHNAGQITATAIAPGTATNVQGILAELAARITALEGAGK